MYIISVHYKYTSALLRIPSTITFTGTPSTIIGLWSQCSVTCGHGSQNRIITSITRCGAQSQTTQSRSCHQPICPGTCIINITSPTRINFDVILFLSQKYIAYTLLSLHKYYDKNNSKTKKNPPL